MTRLAYDAVWINGSVGAGKTTAADQLGEELEKRGVPGAVIDVDWLRRAWPAPREDPFQFELAVANMRAVAAQLRARGAQVIVAAGVVETAEQFDRCVAALGSGNPLLVRLVLDTDVALARLGIRHGENARDLEWHERRHPELAGILERAQFAEELVLDTTSLAATDIAVRIADRLTN
ncbi:AAA family ATPase [Leifsonia sp. SIMBA_070]|uniref:AAA family ATPase n=1 Tax=Leifsonia sp. SIMBA_070 TaxID=3085810 RepID=UPI00397950D0